jgi:hypothetical protein
MRRYPARDGVFGKLYVRPTSSLSMLKQIALRAVGLPLRLSGRRIVLKYSLSGTISDAWIDAHSDGKHNKFRDP